MKKFLTSDIAILGFVFLFAALVIGSGIYKGKRRAVERAESTRQFIATNDAMIREVSNSLATVGDFAVNTDPLVIDTRDTNKPVWQSVTDAIDPTLKAGDRLIVDANKFIVRDTNAFRTVKPMVLDKFRGFFIHDSEGLTGDLSEPAYKIEVQRDGDRTTNLVLRNYTGTIQVGTNFWTVEQLKQQIER